MSDYYIIDRNDHIDRFQGPQQELAKEAWKMICPTSGLGCLSGLDAMLALEGRELYMISSSSKFNEGGRHGRQDTQIIEGAQIRR